MPSVVQTIAEDVLRQRVPQQELLKRASVHEMLDALILVKKLHRRDTNSLEAIKQQLLSCESMKKRLQHNAAKLASVGATQTAQLAEEEKKGIALQRQLQACQHAMVELRQQTHMIAQADVLTKQELQAMQDKARNLDSQLQAAKAAEQKAREQADLVHDLQRNKQQWEEAKSVLKAKEDALASMEAERQQLQTQIANLVQIQQQLQTERNGVSQQLKNLGVQQVKQKADLMQELQQTKQELEGAQVLLKSKNNSLHSLESAKQKLQGQVRRLAQMKQELRASREAAEQQLMTAQNGAAAQLKNLKQQLLASEQAQASFAQQSQHNKQQWEQAQAMLKANSQSLAANKERLQDQVRELEADRNGTMSQLQSLARELQTFEHATQKQYDVIRELQRERQQWQQTQIMLKEKENLLFTTAANKQQLQEQVQQLRAARNLASEQLSNVGRQLRASEQAQSELKAKADSLAANKQQLEEQVRELTRNQGALHAEHDATTRQLWAQINELVQTQQELQAAAENSETLSLELVEEVARLQKKLNAATTDRNNRVALTRQAAELLLEETAKVQELEQNKRQLMAQLADIKLMLNAQAPEDLKAAKAKAEAELQEARDAQRTLSQEKTQLANAYESARRNLELHGNKLRQTAKFEEQLAQTTGLLKKQQDLLRELGEDFKQTVKKKKALDKELKNLRSSLEKRVLNAAAATSLQNCDTARLELKRASDLLQSREMVVRGLLDRKAKLSSNNVDQVSQAKGALAKMLDDVTVAPDTPCNAVLEKLNAWKDPSRQALLTKLKTIVTNIDEDSRGAVRVYVRISPPVDRSVRSMMRVSPTGDRVMLLDDSNGYHGFHTAFDTDWSNEDVFEGRGDTRGLAPALEQVKAGYAVVLFGYGFSGSGKTHTLLGNSQQQKDGLVQLTLKRLLSPEGNQPAPRVTLHSAFELYQKEVNRTLNVLQGRVILLAPSGKELSGPAVEEEYVVTTANQPIRDMGDLDAILKSIESHRIAKKRIKSTQANATSSRSHLFLVFRVESNETTGYFTMVDMAGAEDTLQIMKATDDKLQTSSNQELEDLVTSYLVPGGGPRALEKPPSGGFASRNAKEFQDHLRKQQKQKDMVQNIREQLQESIFINESLEHLTYFLRQRADLGPLVPSRPLIAKPAKEANRLPSVISPSGRYCLMIPLLHYITSVQLLSGNPGDTQNPTTMKLAKMIMMCIVRQVPVGADSSAARDTLEYVNKMVARS